MSKNFESQLKRAYRKLLLQLSMMFFARGKEKLIVIESATNSNMSAFPLDCRAAGLARAG